MFQQHQNNTPLFQNHLDFLVLDQNDLAFFKSFQSRTGERDGAVGDVHILAEGGRVRAIRVRHLTSQQVETIASGNNGEPTLLLHCLY